MILNDSPRGRLPGAARGAARSPTEVPGRDMTLRGALDAALHVPARFLTAAACGIDAVLHVPARFLTAAACGINDALRVPARFLTAAACALVLAGCGAAAGGEVQEPVPMPDPTPIEYPVALWDSKVQGETELMIHVNEHGDVDSVFVSKASGYAEFDSAAVAGARKLRFTPGRKGEKRVAMWTKMPVRFAQDSTATLGAPRPAGM